MPRIEPFRGFRYTSRDLARLVTPPYDVISPEQQRRYYAADPRNFIRVVYGRRYAGDGAGRNPYTRARDTLTRWIRTGVLQADPEPSLYPYAQRFRAGGKCRTRWGLIALVDLSSPKIYRHERTRLGPIRDRLRLLKTAGASFSPIFGMIPDTQRNYRNALRQACRGKRPVAAFRFEGVEHRLWRLSNPQTIRRMQQLLKGRETVIADGHHRLAAAQTLRRQRRGARTAKGPCDYALFYLSAAGEDEPGLMATHRVLSGVPAARLERFKKRVLASPVSGGKADGLRAVPVASVQEALERLRRLKGSGRAALGVWTGNGSTWLLLAPQGEHRIDVEWLDRILKSSFGGRGALRYTQDVRQAGAWLRRADAQLVFLTQPPRMREVLRWARRNRRMPRKTTYFHPKPLAGLVEHVF